LVKIYSLLSNIEPKNVSKENKDEQWEKAMEEDLN